MRGQPVNLVLSCQSIFVIFLHVTDKKRVGEKCWRDKIKSFSHGYFVLDKRECVQINC